MGAPGINTQLGEVAIEGLASTSGMVLKSVTICTTSRDTGNTPTTNLRKYLALGLDTNGNYSPYDSTNHLEADIVILLEELKDVDHANLTTAVLWHGVMKHDYVITPVGSAAINWHNVQRISIAPTN